MSSEKVAAITTGASYLPYEETGFFSGMVIDYLHQKEALAAFYQYKPSYEEINNAIADRKGFAYDRVTLVASLRKQYEGIAVPGAVARNFDLLLNENTYTITTAHQPNLFTGPLYFIYKILHAVKLAEVLSAQHSANNFVPVFFMGSEDADLDELGYFIVDGKKYEWKTDQTGAVGRMKVDKQLLALMEELNGQLNVLPHGAEMMSIFRKAYKEGETIQQCTLRLVNELFGEYGLIVFIPDAAALKKVFQPVIERELQEQFSHKAVEPAINALNELHYKVQAGGRDLNLFYLIDDKRERIELAGDVFKVPALKLQFSFEQMMQELNDHPERFSPNVILRGVFQEMVLPNIAFIGGGGEIAYWLELKNVFKEAAVPYPMLVLRNSFLLMNQWQHELLNELDFSLTDFFKKPEALLNELVKRDSMNQLSLSEEIGELNSFYQQLHETALAVDATLAQHVNALQAKALKRIQELEKKMLRAEKRKFEAEKRKIHKLRNTAFPNGNLQERTENIAGFYAKYGRSVIDTFYQYSQALEQKFTVITL